MIFGSDSVSSILREDLHGVKVSLAHDYKSGRAKHLCKSWFDRASNGAVDPAGLERTNCSGNREPRTVAN